VAEREYAKHFDSVSVCFSKGLGAPVGSAVAGSEEYIARVRRFRKQFGGGMRQVGIIAAGALYAVENHRQRLAEDHVNARRLAEGLAEMHEVEFTVEEPETNMVYFGTGTLSAAEFCEELRQEGVLMLPVSPNRIRAVTHLDVSAADIEDALDRIASAMRRKRN
jgi:threonine aldolase